MRTPMKRICLKKVIALSIATAAGTGLSGCALEPEPYDGDFDPNFYDSIETYAGEEVSLSAEVLDVLSPTSFTIISGDDPTANPLLVLNEADAEDVLPGMPVQVTGAVKEAFDPSTAEEDLGVNLDDALYEDWIGDFYLEVTAIDAPAE
ncbi:hypothetical protein [Arthrobacter sp. Soil782]|uniref:hypothetical protein n=1 Tax=Arthrobacter sp. Soil782 TaxID=1736410 RepID=UPI000A545E7D|nr:hypothetical protein [Arthrobacter sp. Soil782]